MPCLIGCLALSAPRVALVLVWVFGTLIQSAYDTRLWPLLGLAFMPMTTLAYAWADVRTGGSIGGLHLAVLILAVLMDLGLVGGAAKRAKRDEEEVEGQPD